MASLHSVMVNDSDPSDFVTIICARLSQRVGTTTIYSRGGMNQCRTIKIRDMGNQDSSERTHVLVETKCFNGRLRREWIKLKDSVDDLRYVFALAGQDMPPVTKSFLSRLGDIKPFVAILR